MVCHGGVVTVLRVPQPLELGPAVTLAVREMILSGAVAPGERLVETELASRFGTSRGPVRDAFKELEQQGLLNVIPRRGTFVMVLDRDAVDEIYSMRTALEGLAVSRFAPIATGDDVELLRERLVELDEAGRDGDNRLISEADAALHRSFVEGARHARLLSAWDRLADQTLLALRDLAEHRPDLQAAAGDHTAIVDAIEANNGDAARQALIEHLESARSAILAGTADSD